MKVCYGCEDLQFGFSSDGSDACDYVCREEKDGIVIESNLFCTHDLTPKQVTKKLKNLPCLRIAFKENKTT